MTSHDRLYPKQAAPDPSDAPRPNREDLVLLTAATNRLSAHYWGKQRPGEAL